MTSSVTRPASIRPPRSEVGNAVRVDARPPRRRRPLLAVVAALLVIGFGLAGAELYLAGTQRVSVLVVRSAIPEGSPLTASDLGVVQLVPGPGVGWVAATEEAQVVGRVASVPLLAGQLLTPASIATGPDLPRGDATVGVTVGADQAPVAQLAPGAEVEVVATGGQGTAAPRAGASLATGVLVTVADVGTSGSSGSGAAVSIAVPSADAAAVAAAAASGNVSLVVLHAPLSGSAG